MGWFVLFYLVCSVLTYGAVYADCYDFEAVGEKRWGNHESSMRDYAGIIVFMSLLGPLGLFLALLVTNGFQHGLRWGSLNKTFGKHEGVR